MSKIRICREHSCGLESARKAAADIAGEMGQRFGVDSQWEGDQLTFSHSAVKGAIRVSEDTIEVDARLGLLALPLKSMMESRIHDFIDQNLA